MTALSFLLARLKEPSTYGGLGLLLAAAGLHLGDGQIAAITGAAMALAGLASAFILEK